MDLAFDINMGERGIANYERMDEIHAREVIWKESRHR